MVKRIRFEGQIHNFPDDFTDEEISQALSSHPSSQTESLQNKQTEQQNNPELENLKYITGTENTPLGNVRNLAQGTLQGLGKGGQYLMKRLTGGIAPQFDYDDMLSFVGSPNKSASGELLKGIGEYLPYGIAGGPSLLGQLGAGAAFGASTTKPEEENLFGLLPKGETGGAIKAALLNALTHGAFKGLEALRPSKIFRGNLSPEELQRNIELTKGTETGLGDVIESPLLKKKLENTLTSIPFSGANESLQRTGNLVVKKGEDILNKLLGDNSPENVPSQVTDELIKQFKTHQENKNNLYNNSNNIADKIGLKLELPNFSKKAKEFSDAIESTNMLKYEPDVAKIFNKLQNYKNSVKEEQITGSILDTSGKPIVKESKITTPSLKEANILSGKLNHYANISAKSADPAQRNMARIFGELASSLKRDIRSSIDLSGNVNLKNAFNEAEENYKNNFSKFLDKDIYGYISGNKDPETIVNKFIKTSPNADLANQLGKLSEKMSDPLKDLLAYSYLSRAIDNEGNLNPAKLGTAIQKLGPNQLKKLVPDSSMRKELLDYNKLQKMNKESQNLMFNPKTGQRNTDALVTGLLGLLGHGISGNVGMLGAAGLPVIGGKLLTKALTSPKIRESLVEQMIKNNARINKPSIRRSVQNIIQGVKGKD